MNAGNTRIRLVGRLALVLAYLVVLDVIINIVFRYPAEPARNQPSSFQRYFEYGRSVEGKFSRMTETMWGWGWLDGPKGGPEPEVWNAGERIVVALYGMSHTRDLAKAIAKSCTGYEVRACTAPGATANYALAAYQMDKKCGSATAVVLGVMTEGVPYVTTTSGATMHFDMSYPYTYPRYRLSSEGLTPAWPPFVSVKNFMEYRNDSAKWKRYRNWLAQNDRYYNPVLYWASALDASSLIRILRRAYAVRTRERQVAAVYDAEGFKENTEEIAVLRGVVMEFAMVARRNGAIPVVYVINNQGCGDHLLRVLRPVFAEARIPYLSTHRICPPDDPKAFMPGSDGHFTEAKNAELARALISLIEVELANQRAVRGATDLLHGR